MHEQINQYVTQVLLAALALLTVLIKLWLGGLKKKAEAYYEARTTAEQRQTPGLFYFGSSYFVEIFSRNILIFKGVCVKIKEEDVDKVSTKNTTHNIMITALKIKRGNLRGIIMHRLEGG